MGAFKAGFNLFNGLVIVCGLCIVGLSIFYTIRSNTDGVFGSYSAWAIYTPLTMGLVVSFLACCGCGMRLENKKVMLYIYGFILLLVGTTVVGAGGFQVTGVYYMKDISNATDYSELTRGVGGSLHFLSDYTLGMYTKCCLGAGVNPYKSCETSNGLCFFDQSSVNTGLATEAVVCDRISEDGELKLCPGTTKEDDLMEFNDNVYNYINNNFYAAAVALTGFGAVLLMTCFCSCGLARWGQASK